MSIQPTIQFSFAPTCQSFRCCCLSSDDETQMYPCKDDTFKPVGTMSDKEVEVANERFRNIIIRKIDHLPLDNDEFLDRLENEEGISLQVSREDPLTRCRLDDTVKAINNMLAKMHID